MDKTGWTTYDATLVVFDQLERAIYLTRRKMAKHIDRSSVAHIDWMLKVQPMRDEQCYLYRDYLIVSLGGWWTSVALEDKTVVHMQDGTLDGIMDQIDKAINRHISREAVKAVIAKQAAQEHTICPGCKNEIDPEVCHCGDEISKHNPYWCGHNPVPMGCVCGYAPSVTQKA